MLLILIIAIALAFFVWQMNRFSSNALMYALGTLFASITFLPAVINMLKGGYSKVVKSMTTANTNDVAY